MTDAAKLWLSRHVHDEVAGQARLLAPFETGGILLGYVADSATPDAVPDVVVIDAIGAGPGAEHGERWFVPDHDWQIGELIERYEHSGRIAGYVGDWHSHPDGCAVPSRQDLRTMRDIAGHAPAHLDHPTMLIAAPGRRADVDTLRLRAWRWAPRPLCRLSWITLAAAAELLVVDVDGSP